MHEAPPKKEIPKDNHKVMMSKDKFDKLSKFRELCSTTAYQSPKGVGLGSAACIAIDMVNILTQKLNPEERGMMNDEFVKLVKSYPKHGRPRTVFTKHGGPTRSQVKKEQFGYEWRQQ